MMENWIEEFAKKSEKEKKSLKFQPRFLSAVKIGEKNLTTRKKGRYGLKTGDTVVLDFGKEKLKAEILGVFETRISFEEKEVFPHVSISADFFRREGFFSKEEFFQFLSRFSYSSGAFETFSFRVFPEDSLRVSLPEPEVDPITGEIRKPENCEGCSA